MAKWTRETFAAEVRKQEIVAQQDPQGYRLRVGMLAALGYAFIFFLILVLVLILALVVVLIIATHRFNIAFLKILIPVVLLLAGVLRSLWVQFDKPEGIRLSENNAAPLFISVRRMTDRLGAPRFHDILLTADFNAGVVQWPRLGIFGWHKNYLTVGLPLMQSLSREQFEAVLAHELGHLRGGHGRFGAWVYQVNQTWQQLLGRLGDSGAAGAALRAFFRWYAPYFAAASFALRRQDEYEADRCAAQLTSPRTIADALCLLPVYDGHLDRHFWEDLAKSVETSPVPPSAPYSRMLNFLSSAPPVEEDAEKALENALREETGTVDTHPSLTDRLKALGESPRLAPKPEQTAAIHFFGHHLPRLTEQLDHVWEGTVRPIWEEKHKAASEARKRLEELNAKAATGPLSDDDAWWRAEATEGFHGEEAALPLYEELRQRPDLATSAAFAIGRILLERNDPSGVPLLREVMAKEPGAALAALGLIHDFEKRQGNDEAAKAIRVEGMRFADKVDDAQEERSDFGNSRTVYLPHQLDETKLAPIRAVIARFPDVAEAYFACKPVVHFSDKPLYVLGVTLTNEWRRFKRDEDAAKLQQELLAAFAETESLPGECFIVVMAGNTAWLKKSLAKVPEAKIYTRIR